MTAPTPRTAAHEALAAALHDAKIGCWGPETNAMGEVDSTGNSLVGCAIRWNDTTPSLHDEDAARLTPYIEAQAAPPDALREALPDWSPVNFVGGRLVLELAHALKEDPLDRNQQSEAIAVFVRAWLDGVLERAALAALAEQEKP